MHILLRRTRLFLPLTLLLAALLIYAPAGRTAPVSVAYSVDPLPQRTYSVSGTGSTTVTIALAKRSGTAALTPGVTQTVQTTGSVHTTLDYDSAYALRATDTYTRTFHVDSVGHPQTQTANIVGDGDDETGDYYDELSLTKGFTVTYDLGTKGKVDVTPLAFAYDTDFSPNAPIQYRFLLHDVPGYAAVKSVVISPGTVYGGATTYGKVSLASPAPAGGTVVGLTVSPEGIATAPDTVTVPAGRTFITFPITTVALTADPKTNDPPSDTPFTISATAGGAGASGALTVLARYQMSGTVTSGSTPLTNVNVTAKSTGTFILTSTSTTSVPIPDNSAAGIMSSIQPNSSGTIGSLIVGIDITHPHIADLVITLQGPDGTTVFLQNKTGGTQQNLQTSYPVLNTPGDSLSAFNGKAVQGTWKLTVKDMAGGNVGTLNGWNLTFSYDGTVTKSSASYYGRYLLSDLKENTYTVTPTLSGNTLTPTSRTVTLGPNGSGSPTRVNFEGGPVVSIASGVDFPNDEPIGGSTTTGIVTLSKPALAGGLVVELSSDTPALVSFPSSVTVAEGQTKAKFTVKTTPPSGDPQKVIFTASAGGGSDITALVISSNISALSVSPASVTGGTGATGTVTLTGYTEQPLTVSLQSSNPGAASVPSSVTVPQYASSVTFPITTSAGGASTKVTITGKASTVTKTTTVTVTP